MDLINLAKSVAEEYHNNDMYGEHNYYQFHILGVHDLVKQHNLSEKHEIVALLHDIHEDHKYPIDLIISKFGYDVGVAVQAISYNKGYETREEYYRRVLKNDIARDVKRFDAMFNKNHSIKTQDKKRAKYYEDIEKMMSK